MKTADIPVYGKNEVYIKYCAVCLKIEYTLRCLEYMCSFFSPLRLHGPLNHEDTDKCTQAITYCTPSFCVIRSVYL